MSVTPHETARDFLEDENGISTREVHDEEDNDDMPQNLALGDLDITSSCVSLKGVCTHISSYPVGWTKKVVWNAIRDDLGKVTCMLIVYT